MTPAFLVLLFLLAIPARASEDEEPLTDDEPLDGDVSESIARANEGITTYLVDGDIRPNTQRNADPCVRKGCMWPKSGRYVVVPISISSAYTISERNVIIKGLDTFHASTCIRFVTRKSQTQFIHVFSGSGCWSSIGRQPREQSLSLRKNGCVSTGTVQHEVLHALGFNHEHVRSDRDSYVSILFQNISPGREQHFNKKATNNLGTPYDFNSVMHYGSLAFSKNRKLTIISKANPNRRIGPNRSMSQNDIIRVNKLYKCCE